MELITEAENPIIWVVEPVNSMQIFTGDCNISVRVVNKLMLHDTVVSKQHHGPSINIPKSDSKQLFYDCITKKAFKNAVMNYFHSRFILDWVEIKYMCIIFINFHVKSLRFAYLLQFHDFVKWWVFLEEVSGWTGYHVSLNSLYGEYKEIIKAGLLRYSYTKMVQSHEKFASIYFTGNYIVYSQNRLYFYQCLIRIKLYYISRYNHCDTHVTFQINIKAYHNLQCKTKTSCGIPVRNKCLVCAYYRACNRY